MATLESAVTAARQRYIEANPNSRHLAGLAAEVMPGGNTRSVLHFDPFPLRVESIDGPHLVDVDGHRYLDLLGNFSAGLLGHSPVAVRRAVSSALEGGWTSGAMRTAEIDYASLVCQRFPSIETVRFTNSGTEANLMAIATAKHFTGRESVLAFHDAYHGGVLFFGESGRPLLTPHRWVVTDYNDLDQVRAVFSRQPGEIACVIVEPMLAASGCIPGTPEFLNGLREVTEEAGSLLIFDEVMTSRLSPSGAQGALGIKPDLTTLGKYIAGGLSVGAFGGRRDVMSVFDPGHGAPLTHGGTFNNNELSVAAGVAVLGEVLTDELVDSVNERGDHLRTELNDVFTKTGVEMIATGWGSLLTLHAIKGPVISPQDLAPANDHLEELLFFDLLEEGYYLARRGFIALSMDITDEHVNSFVDDVEAWAQTARHLTVG
jgi:glutamate-1-semialdehyde 2,1-aminomutase